MSKVWLLKYYANQYDQLGGYTMCVFAKKPDFHKLKKVLDNYTGDHPLPNSMVNTYDACIGMLSRGESVLEMVGGGDEWVLEEEQLF